MENSVELFQILKKMILLKCYTQYAKKTGKLKSSYRNGKDKVSFQSQRKAMPKNVQTTIQLCSCPLLARLGSKFFKLGFNNM